MVLNNDPITLHLPKDQRDSVSAWHLGALRPRKSSDKGLFDHIILVCKVTATKQSSFTS